MDYPPARTRPPAAAEDPLLSEAARLASALASRWRRGIACRAEELFADHPSLAGNPEAAVRVIYEEVCQRQELGQEVPLSELARRFPQWKDKLAVVLDCHRLLGLDAGPRFPAVGEALGDCRLVAELGRGARGRVYLAEQAYLAGRLLVVKLTPGGGQEHLTLARLQHTNIVPLYSVRDFPDRNLRELAMPCLGGATLQQVFGELRDTPPERRTGPGLLAALEAGAADRRLCWPARGPGRRFLEEASYVQAVCWVGVCLADGLHHAHERGLVHLDVKPSNVLLTADCVPMLLDFHLARGPLPPGAAGPAAEGEWLGGTPAYMSPEQRAAWRSCQEGRPVPAAVDARSDVYSLGLVLREALTGEPPGREPAPARLPPRPDLSPGLRDLLARCLHPDPALRYPSAALLAEDLRRHLTHRPLVGVPNRSVRERWRKWSRRRPRALPLLLAAAACLTAVAALAALAAAQALGQLHEADTALGLGRRQQEAGRHAEAVASFDRGLAHLPGAFVGGSLRAELVQERERAAWSLEAARLHERVEQSHYLHGEELTPATLRALEVEFRGMWEGRGRLLGEAGESPGRETVRHDLIEVALLWSYCRVRRAGPEETDRARRESLAVLDEAETLLGPSPALARERAALGGAARPGEPGRTPANAWEFYTLGRWLLRAGDADGAAAAFDRAVGLRPGDFWPWFGKGLCADHRGRPEEAETAFTVCTALAPGRAECYHDRARARAARGDLRGATEDADRALELNPRLAPAALNRGALHLRQRHFDRAEADFRLARELGAGPAAVYYNEALLHQARGERAAATASLDSALRHDPGHQPSRELLDRLRPR